MKKRIVRFLMIVVLLTCVVQAQERIEQWKGKTVMVSITPPAKRIIGQTSTREAAG